MIGMLVSSENDRFIAVCESSDSIRYSLFICEYCDRNSHLVIEYICLHGSPQSDVFEKRDGHF